VAQQRLPVRKIREVLRLKAAGLSDRKIAAAIGSARSTVQECLRRAGEAGIAWPLAQDLNDEALHARLYQRSVPLSCRPQPDFAQLHAELARAGVTRLLLWQEYKAAHPDGWRYSAFCDQYRQWLSSRELVLRQNHAPGEKLFVDYAGQTIPIVDRHSGEARPAQIFVAVLGCSNYTYAEATWTQALPDWLGSHVRAFQFIGGAPAAIVPDNLKSAVTRAHRYEPQLNPSYQDFAEHYGLAILPARVRKPRDKAKVEAGVLVVERWILARLRHRTFFSLSELNAAIRELLESLNNRVFKKLEGCRRSRFEALEQPALRPLPARAYEFGQWKKAKVHPDYHIQVGRAYYSVPYRLIGKSLDVRVAAHTIEIFHAGELVAAHLRSAERGPPFHARCASAAATRGGHREQSASTPRARRRHRPRDRRGAAPASRAPQAPGGNFEKRARNPAPGPGLHARRSRTGVRARRDAQEFQLSRGAHAHRNAGASAHAACARPRARERARPRVLPVNRP
jgi:transposase